jgi:hypothetical protein
MRKGWPLILLLLLSLVVAVPAADAGMLTSGSYTYLYRGDELDLPVDILPQRGGYLVPEELLADVGLRPAVDGERIALERGPVKIEMALGDTLARMDARDRLLQVAPVRIAGRLFLPAEVLPEMAISLNVDGKLVTLANYAVGRDSGYFGLDPDPGFERRRQAHTLQAAVRDGSLSRIFGRQALTLCTP